MMAVPVVISGIGVVSPLGLSVPEMTQRFCAGAGAVGPLPTGVDGGWGAQVGDLPLEAFPANAHPRIGRLDRLARLFLSAAHLAVMSAGLEITEADAARCGISFGTGFGCLLTNAEYNERLNEFGPAGASPRLFAATVSSAAAGEVSIALGIQGPNVTTHMGFAAGLEAIGYGADLIRTGKADVMLAGGADALGAALVRGLRDMGLLKTRQPLAFGEALPGVCPSEGAMVAVLEHRDHAQRRGAHACARIEGYASGFEPTLARRNRASTGIAFTMQRALAASGHAASEIDLVMTSAHGTPVDDTECEALSEVFGQVRSPVLLAPKAVWGECFAAAPVLSLALATALLQPPVPTLARGLAFELDGAQARVADAETRLGNARLAMVHGLCYSGPSVALVVARDQ